MVSRMARAMAASAMLAVTLIPVLMGYLIRGRIPREHANPLNRLLIAAYRPLLRGVLRFPKLTLAFALGLLRVSGVGQDQLAFGGDQEGARPTGGGLLAGAEHEARQPALARGP